jgi:hypothetical protein
MSIFNLSLDSANALYGWSNAALIIGGVLVLLGTIGAFWSTAIRERYSDERISRNEADAAKANEHSRALEVELAKTNERAAKAELRVAEANRNAEDARRETAKHELELVAQRKDLADSSERAAKAEARAAEAQLDLARFKAPRTISHEQETILVKHLSQLSGEKIRVEPYTGSQETENFAHQLAAAFNKAGVITEVRPILTFGGARSGITANMGSDRKNIDERIANALIASKLISGPLAVTTSRDAQEFTLVIAHK